MEITKLNEDRNKFQEALQNLIKQEEELKAYKEGIIREDETFKKLLIELKNAMNNVVTYTSKEPYAEEIKQKNFLNSKICVLYGIIWCLVFNHVPKDEKTNPELDFTEIDILTFTQERVSGYHKEFVRCITDFATLKGQILNFKAKIVTEVSLNIMIEIIRVNNLFNMQGKVFHSFYKI